MTTKMFETIFKNVDATLLTEDVKSEVEQLITEAIEDKVKARTLELKESYDTKEKELKESYDTKEKDLASKMEENERVLMEEAQKYKAEVEEAAITETKLFKERKDAELAEEATRYLKDVEAMVLEEAKNLKANTDAALVEEVKKFRSELIEKVSDYMEAQLQESIPAELMEAAAKLEVYQPLVESIQNAFSANFIKFDTTSYKMLKEAHDQIESLKSEVQQKTKDEINLKKEMKNVKRNMKVENLTEGLTTKQKSRAIKLLEGVELEELDTRFERIRDVLIEDATSTIPQHKKVAESKQVQKLEESSQVETKTTTDSVDDEIVKHQVRKVIKESEVKQILNENKQPTKTQMTRPEISAWQNKLNKQRNRS